MPILFLARGTGSTGAAADYLLGARDATGRPREGVEVLRGDPHRVAAVADALSFEHKYTSGVIAWAPEDEPTDEQIGAVLDAFEGDGLGGTGVPDRYAWSAVLHREHGGGAHVHVLATRCDLETGRSLTSPHRAGRRRSARSGTPSTPNTAGLVQTTRAGQGAATRTPRLHRGGAAAGGPPAT